MEDDEFARWRLWAAMRSAVQQMNEAQGIYLAAAKKEARLTLKILTDEGYGDTYEAKWAAAFLAGDNAECERLRKERK